MPQPTSKMRYTLTNYSRGAAFERKIKKQYEEAGWFVVRAAGSKGPVDLVAVLMQDDYIDVLLIQCKAQKPTKRERDDFIAFLTENGLLMHGVLIWPDGSDFFGG